MKVRIGVVSVLLALLLSFTSCDSSIFCSHEYVLTSRSLCTEEGTAEYECTKCHDTYSETVSAARHNYDSGICERCGYAMTDVSDIPAEMAFFIVERLKLQRRQEVQGENEVESKNILLALGMYELEECVKKAKEADKTLKEVKESRTIRVYNAVTNSWEWQADPNAVARAQRNLEYAMDDAMAQSKTCLYMVISLDMAVEANVYQEIIDLFQSGAYTDQAILEIFQANLKSHKSLGEDSASFEQIGMMDIYNAYSRYHGIPDWVGDILNTIYEVSGYQANEG